MWKLESLIQFICWIAFIIHFIIIAESFFSEKMPSTTINNEKLSLKNFPIIIKICIDPAFDEKNHGYNNPQEFILGMRLESELGQIQCKHCVFTFPVKTSHRMFQVNLTKQWKMILTKTSAEYALYLCQVLFSQLKVSAELLIYFH